MAFRANRHGNGIVLIGIIIIQLWFYNFYGFGKWSPVVDIHGKVVDSRGRPVPHIDVFFMSFSHKKPVAVAKTDAKGRFVFRSFDPTNKTELYSASALVAFKRGSYIGWCTGPLWYGYLPDSIENKPFDITVAKPHEATVRVVDEHGEPLAGVSVKTSTVYSSEKGIGRELLDPFVHFADGVTGSDGTYSIRGLPRSSRVEVNAGKEGYIAREEPGEDRSNLVVLVPSGKLAGKIVDENGKPVGGIEVYARGASERDAVTSVDGRYQLEVVPGNYRVCLWKSGSDQSSKWVRVEADQTARVDMTAGEGVMPAKTSPKRVPVTGTVVDPWTSRPVAGAMIRSMTLEHIVDTSSPVTLFDDYDNGHALSDKRGRFRIRVAPGEVMFYCSKGPNHYYRDSKSCIVSIGSAGKNGIKLRPARAAVVRGRVVYEDGSPAAGVWVDSIDNAGAYTDRSGRFLMPMDPDHVQVGLKSTVSYYLDRLLGGSDNDDSWLDKYHSRVGFAAFNKDMSNGGGRYYDVLPSRGIKITLKPVKTLTLRIRDPKGKPVSDADVFADTSKTYPAPSAHAESNSAGLARLHPLWQDAVYTADIAAAGFNPRKLTLPPTGSKGWKDVVEVVMKPATRAITGKVIDESGKPVEGAKVFYEHGPDVYSDAHGRFRLSRVPDGKVSIYATLSDYVIDGSKEIGPDAETVVIRLTSW